MKQTYFCIFSILLFSTWSFCSFHQFKTFDFLIMKQQLQSILSFIFFIESARIGKTNKGANWAFAFDSDTHIIGATHLSHARSLRFTGTQIRMACCTVTSVNKLVLLQLTVYSRELVAKTTSIHIVIRWCSGRQDVMVRESCIVDSGQVLRLGAPSDCRLQMLAFCLVYPACWGLLVRFAAEIRVAHTHIVYWL